MADNAVYPVPPEADGLVRETDHRAVLQPGQPRVSYEDELYQEKAAMPATASATDTSTTAYVPPASVPDYAQITTEQPPAPMGQNSSPPEASQTANVPAIERFPGVQKPVQEEFLLEWEALSRPYKARTRQYFSSVLIIGLLISMILFFAGQVLPIAVVIAAVFLVYVLSVVPPGMVKHSITTFGIRVEDSLYYWEQLGRFWFSEKYGQQILHIETSRFPGRLTILLGDLSKKNMQILLSEVLVHKKPELTLYEKGAAWLQEKIPLDND